MLKSFIKEDDAKHGDDPHLERIGCGVEVDVLEACHAGFVRTSYDTTKNSWIRIIQKTTVTKQMFS
jgi:hypothetical protein